MRARAGIVIRWWIESIPRERKSPHDYQSGCIPMATKKTGALLALRDAKADKKAGVKEGSKADVKADKKAGILAGYKNGGKLGMKGKC